MQILKNHGLNITSLRVLLKAVENSVDLMAITVKYDDPALVSAGLMRNLKQGGAEHKFLKNHKLYSIVFISYKSDTYSVLIRSRDQKLYSYNELKSVCGSRMKALEMALFKHITEPSDPMELMSRANKPDPVPNIPMPEEPLDYEFNTQDK